jgi:U3 small nucleolar RNA-associated protein 6
MFFSWCLSCFLQVLAQAIRYHPKVHGLWIYAAAWEFDQNLNVAAARALMQSGLRSCPESEDMWIEYLRMELTYLNKLKARKVALGEDVKTLQKNNSDAGHWKEENKELFMSLNEEGEGPKESGSTGVALEEKEDLFWQQGLLIIETIYHGAVEALPSSLALRKKFLEILNSVDLAHSDELKIEVLDDLKKDFSHSEDYWDWFARLQLTDLTGSCPTNRKDALLNKLNRSIQVKALSCFFKLVVFNLKFLIRDYQ